MHSNKLPRDEGIRRGTDGATSKPAKASSAPTIASSTALYIINKLNVEWTSQFIIANRGYGDWAENGLGLKGEFVEIHRKAMRLKHLVWEENWESIGESPREVLMDMIGHCFLAITAIDNEAKEGRSGDEKTVSNL